ncbi:hypothetical protein GO988_16025 [Hymenobacter sp. HMF4947]|uniref:Trimeric autotransporter adhesin YadA-like head domain-containing protein n=1 Tax=Hymenobacter ginkgonis TaxID=2682976 RepID=A0A7K1THC3_9BACT|nr:hypothetical protein [Hymenobacter ginkgonis]MVN77840.1 hypothetical protein [Hymenobacter ginkgonis]
MLNPDQVASQGPGGFLNLNGGPTDPYYALADGAPYPDVAAACAAVPVPARKSRTVNVAGVEMQWAATDTSDAGLKVKTAAAVPAPQVYAYGQQGGIQPSYGQHTASGGATVIGGGSFNTASGGNAAVFSGYGNVASGHLATIAGGVNNYATAETSTIGGGANIQATGQYSTVPGGLDNQAGGDYSFSTGRNNKAMGAYCNIFGGQDCYIGAACTNVVFLNCNGLMVMAGSNQTYYNNVLLSTSGRYKGAFADGTIYVVGDTVLAQTSAGQDAIYVSTANQTGSNNSVPNTFRGWSFGYYLVTSNQADALNRAYGPSATNAFATMRDLGFSSLSNETAVTSNGTTFFAANSNAAVRFLGGGAVSVGMGRADISAFAPRVLNICSLRVPAGELAMTVNLVAANGEPQPSLDGATTLTLQPGEFRLIGVVAKTSARSSDYKTLLVTGTSGGTTLTAAQLAALAAGNPRRVAEPSSQNPFLTFQDGFLDNLATQNYVTDSGVTAKNRLGYQLQSGIACRMTLPIAATFHEVRIWIKLPKSQFGQPTVATTVTFDAGTVEGVGSLTLQPDTAVLISRIPTTDTTQTFERTMTVNISAVASGGVGVPAVGANDIEITDAMKGLIQKDRATGQRFRLVIINGALGTEAL